MGDLTKCSPSVGRASAAAPAGFSGAGSSGAGAGAPVTMISGIGAFRVIMPLAEGFFSRIRRSPLEYSNSSRLCSFIFCRSCSICWISGLAMDGLLLDFEGFLGFIPVSELNEISRPAGQDFRPIPLNGYIVLNPYPADAFHINSWFNRYHVSLFQQALLALCNPRLFVDFQTKSMARAVNEKLVQFVTCQYPPRCCVHSFAGYPRPGRRNRRLLGFLHCSMPLAHTPRRPSGEDRPRNVAAIVAEYNTQVQHHQLIFPQSLGSGSRMRDRRPCASGIRFPPQSRVPAPTASASECRTPSPRSPGSQPFAFVPILKRPSGPVGLGPRRAPAPCCNLSPRLFGARPIAPPSGCSGHSRPSSTPLRLGPPLPRRTTPPSAEPPSPLPSPPVPAL